MRCSTFMKLMRHGSPIVTSFPDLLHCQDPAFPVLSAETQTHTHTQIGLESDLSKPAAQNLQIADSFA